MRPSMRNVKAIVLIITLVVIWDGEAGHAQPDVSATSTSSPRCIVLEGSPYNRGLVHGKTLKKEISEIVNLWKTDLRKNHKTDPDVFITKYL